MFEGALTKATEIASQCCAVSVVDLVLGELTSLLMGAG